jgi:hypothetical protein
VEILEGVAVPGVSSDSSESENLVDCEWKDCATNHLQTVNYPNNGVLDRSSGFAAAWVAADLEPWKKYGDGTDSFAKLNEYRGETPNAAYAFSAAAMTHPEYHTQKHHLISINLFKNVPKLKHDAKLAGYRQRPIKKAV